jgi:hypothetical protein
MEDKDQSSRETSAVPPDNFNDIQIDRLLVTVDECLSKEYLSEDNTGNLVDNHPEFLAEILDFYQYGLV